MKRLVFTVTNDLTYDQRMIRICSSLAQGGFRVTLVGRKMADSIPLQTMPYQQERLNCIFSRGFLFYAEYNVRLFFHLLFAQCDLICAIDLDTILPVLWISKLRNKPRVYDAHELFCEMKEIVSRPSIYRFWKVIERYAVPSFKYGYTVNTIIAEEFRKMYNVNYGVIRNMPVLKPLTNNTANERYVLYQGAVNEGRCFEWLIPAFKQIECRLIICGDGNFMRQAQELVSSNGLQNKVIFTGRMLPSALEAYTRNATVGITLFDQTGLSNYYSLANRFFDYMHAGVPQVCVNYPVYRTFISDHKFAILIDDISVNGIASAINKLLNDELLYNELKENCLAAREKLNWQLEEKTLLALYNKILSGN